MSGLIHFNPFDRNESLFKILNAFGDQARKEGWSIADVNTSKGIIYRMKTYQESFDKLVSYCDPSCWKSFSDIYPENYVDKGLID